MEYTEDVGYVCFWKAVESIPWDFSNVEEAIDGCH